jgi:ABC-type sugar transport system substrate-binding protein
MKKGLFGFIGIVLLALLALVGCSKKETAAPAASAAAAASVSTAKPVIGYIAKNRTDPFHFPLNSAAEKIMADLKANGVIADWHFYDGLTDPLTQVSLMDTAITQGCTHIIFLPAESAGSAPVLDKAASKGIPVVVVNSTTSNTDALAAGYVGSNDVQAGEMMAQFIQSKYPAGGGWGHIMGPIGNSAQLDRTQGAHNILDKDSNWTLLDEQTGNWQGDQAATFAEQWNTKFGTQFNALICDNDDMSSAAQNVLNGRGRRDIVAIGVDGNEGPLSMIKAGDLQATIYQDGVGQVTKGLELLVDIMNGKTIAKRTMVDFVLITKDNVDQYLKK